MGTIFREPPKSHTDHSDRTARDRSRHKEKLRKALRSNIADIVAEESLIGQSKDKIIKVPLRGIREYRFVFGENESGASQGDENSTVGQIIGKIGKDGSPIGEASDKPGQDYYETEVTLEELINIMFEDLELPELERKALRQIISLRFSKRKGFRSAGIRPRLDKKNTAKSRIKRKVASSRNSEEEPESFPFHNNDLVYRYFDQDFKPESSAVVFCIMDVSGSMDSTKKYLARSFFFLLYQFLANKYQKIEVVFIAHHTEASEVTEDEFFHKGESGGTMISSGYQKTLDIIQQRYHPSLWNIYCFHCSDGDNFPSDNQLALNLAGELAQVSNLFGYCEIVPRVAKGLFSSAITQMLESLNQGHVECVSIEDKEDIFPGFKQLLSKEREKE